MWASSSSKIDAAFPPALRSYADPDFNSELERGAISREESGYEGIRSNHSFFPHSKEGQVLKRRGFQGWEFGNRVGDSQPVSQWLAPGSGFAC